jgi:hypothetical protein
MDSLQHFWTINYLQLGVPLLHDHRVHSKDKRKKIREGGGSKEGERTQQQTVFYLTTKMEATDSSKH